MKKIAIVNQRYGLEVNGGSEYYTRLIAEHLSKYYDIEVLTTTALNYDTWENYYPEGKTEVNGIKVRRFPVEQQRNMLRFRIVSKLARMGRKCGICLDKIWINEQGPKTPKLIQYIKGHKNEYDVFIFVTYLYYTTVMGLPEVAEKAILIPTAHDEPFIHFPIYHEIFMCPQKMIFLTEEEKIFVHNHFKNKDINNQVIGVGINIPNKLMDYNYRRTEILMFRKKFSISGDYMIYAGRVDVGKNCDEMFQYFIKYKRNHPEDEIKLVVMGKDLLGIPHHSDIYYLGFVSEEDKYRGIAGAKLLWLPSIYESLSIALLEAMALGVPGFVNGNCEVLKGHCEKSGGAVYYKDEQECVELMEKLKDCTIDEYNKLSSSAKYYVNNLYNWERIEQSLIETIDRR